MAARPIVTAAAAAVLLALAGCAPDAEPLVAAGDEVGQAEASASAETPETSPAVGLTELARQASEQLAEDPAYLDSGVLAADPEQWWVTIEVDLPLDEAGVDDPIGSLPPPFDGLASAVASLRIVAQGPDGPVGSRLEAPFTGLRPDLDGSNQPVTTVPGDPPPQTATWPILDPRIISLSVAVVDFDATPAAPEILALVDASAMRLGPPGGFVVTTAADASGGVRATMPPLTGTTLPRQADG